MQISKKNVVHMDQFDRLRPPSGKDGSDLVGSCGELAAKRLSEVFCDTLQRIADELLEQADKSIGLDMRRFYSDASGFARDRNATLASDFRKLYYQRYLRICRRERVAPNKLSDRLDPDQLNLVESDQLEESLATGNIANAINNLCGEEMFGLSKRIGVMLDDPDLVLGENPLAAERIADTIMELMQSHDLAVKARLALVPVLNRHLPQAVRGVYQEINKFLIERGVLPSIRVSLRKPVRESSVRQDAGIDAATLSPSGPPGEEQGLLSVLQQLTSMGRTSDLPGGAPQAPGARAGVQAGNRVSVGQPGSFSVPIGPAPVFFQTLTQLQHGQTDAISEVGLDSARLADGQINVLHLLRNSNDAGNLPQVDAMTLDIVAMVFDYILDDHRIPDAMKALIGRLQIPVLKVAMLDRTFFSQKNHATRRLLDVLAEASMGWNEEEGHDSGLYRKIEQVVQTVLNEFDEQIDIFVTVLDDFLAYQAEESHRINTLTSHSAKIIQHREEMEIAGLVARDEIRIHLLDEPVPEVISNLLHDSWLRYLAGLYTDHGEGSAEWRQALTTIDDLIWSVKPKVSADERKRLVSLLPGLLNRLESGLRAAGEETDSCNKFFTALVKCHADAVRAGLRHEPETHEPTAATEPTEPLVIAASATDSADVLAQSEPDQTTEFESIPELDEIVEPDSAIMAELAEPTEEKTRIELAEPGMFIDAGDASTDADRFVRQLKRGTWIEFDQEDGSTHLAKLAWISPRQGVYLFTNRLGLRAMSIKPEGLASKFREGKIRIVDSMPLIDRAMNSLVEHLRGAA